MIRPPGKWIKGLSPSHSALDVARKVLAIRLHAVEQMLPLAVDEAGEDPEHIHQLRVATRRADAALRLFRPCIDEEKLRNARRRLRRIRRAAGAARECDVHRGIFQKHRESADADLHTVLDDIIAWIESLREDAQHDVARVARRYPLPKLQKKHRRLVKTLHAPRLTGKGACSPPTFLDLARDVLPDHIDAMHAAAAEDLHQLENLHGLRIAGKRVRYAMEVFQPCFGPGFKPLYAQVESLQEELGAINDLHEIIARIQRYDDVRGDARPAEVSPRMIAALTERYQRKLDAGADEFRARWEAGEWQELLAMDLTSPELDPLPCRA